ncbi:MAG: adenosine deaminase family protein, partial [Candidatus Acidiferrales bacterium]
LHNHLSGAVPFDNQLAIAIRHNYRVGFERNTGKACGWARPDREPNWVGLCRRNLVEYKPAAGLTSTERERLKQTLTADFTDAGREELDGFAEFVRIFRRLGALTDNADVMPELVQAVMEVASENRVSYVELKLNPLDREDSQENKVKVEEMVARLAAAVEEKNRSLGGYGPVMVKFIVLVIRDRVQDAGGATDIAEIACRPDCPARLRQAYYLAARRLGGVVVGMDLAGLPETEVRSPAYLPAAFGILRGEFGEAAITLHAGETRKPEWRHHIAQALDAGARRIGHGFNLHEADEATRRRVCRGDIALETSLTSNHLLGLVPQGNLGAHPFPRYFRAEICPADARPAEGYLPVTLNTDDPGVFETDLSKEFFRAVTTFNLSWDEVKRLCRNSLERAFATEEERQNLLRRWEREVAEFEATILAPP